MPLFTPRTLAYLSISLAGIVFVITLGIILFPKFFKRLDKIVVYNGKETDFKSKVAYFFNDVIMPIPIVTFYFFLSGTLLIIKEYRIFLIGIMSIVMVSIAFWCLKRITQRPRPKDAKIHFTDFSFPSGHTAAGFVFFLSIALAFTWIFDIHHPEGLFALALIGGSIVAWSRRYLHVHWISDVIVGSFLGIGCFIFSYLLVFYFGDAIFLAIEQVFFSLT